ncbi:MAG TPA: hypothetical protein VGM06_10595 [Polyangiaceae bacterium]|jgi:hypothetical protein
MSAHDTTPPPAAPSTTPALPDDEMPIPVGAAEARIDADLDTLARAFASAYTRLAATAQAIARALDAAATK